MENQYFDQSDDSQVPFNRDESLPHHETVRIPSFAWGNKNKPAPPAHKSSFFDRLRLVDDPQELGDPQMAQIFPEEDFITFSLVHNVESEHARALSNGVPYSSMILDGILHRLWAWVRGFDPIGEALKTDFKLPVAELHTPNVSGSWAVYNISQSTKKQTSLFVSIAGIGAGGAVNKTLSTESEIMVSPGNCLGLLCDGTVLIQCWENRDENKILNLVDVIEVSDMAYPVPLHEYPFWDEGNHVCLDANAYDLFRRKIKTNGLRLGEDYLTSEPLVPFVTTISIEESDKYSAKFRFPLGPEELMKLEVSSHFTETMKGKFNLPGHYKYIAAFEAVDKLPLTWAAQKIV